MSYCLCIDTSLFGASMALVAVGASNPNSGVLWMQSSAERHSSAAILSHLWAEAQTATGLSSGDIAGLVVSVGPGSFTGIKVGLAWAYGFASVAPRALRWLGLSALEEAATLLQARTPEKSALLVLPSTQTHAYGAYAAALPAQRGAGAAPATAFLLNSAEGLGSLRSSGAEPASCYCCGSWPALPALLADRSAEGVVSARFEEVAVAELMELGLRGMVQRLHLLTQHEGLQALSLALPQARYLRQSTAEEKLEQKLKENREL